MSYLKQATIRAATIVPSDTTNIPIVGSVAADGAGSSITVGGGGEIVTATLTVFGLQYITAPTITVSTATGSAAVLTAVLDPATGAIASISIDDPGTLYDAADTLIVSGGTFADAQPCVVYVGGTGNVKVMTAGGDIVLFTAVQVGTIIGGASPINIVRVYSTDTTAVKLTALW